MKRRSNEEGHPGKSRAAAVCREFGLQPYVLRFWEGEIPQLGRRIGPKRLYGPVERRIVAELKRLIEGEGRTIAEARDRIATLFPLDPGGSRFRAGEGPHAAEATASGEPGTIEDLRRSLAEERRARRRLAERVRELETALAAEREAARAVREHVRRAWPRLMDELHAIRDALARARAALKGAPAADAPRASSRSSARDAEASGDVPG